MTPPSERTSGTPLLSVVSPVHDEEQGIATFVERTREVLAGLPLRHEIVLVDDGSTDGSWKVITELGRRYPDVRALRLSRNFGKEAAVIAGLHAADGDAVVVMDSDLQHPPSLLPALVERWRAGAVVVEAVKRTRTGQSLPARLGAWAFNGVFSRLTGVDLTDASDYRLLARPAVDALLQLPERALFFRGTSTWIGFPRDRVTFTVEGRAAGGTRWSLRALGRLAINGITAFTAAPLHLVTLAGLVFAFFAVVLGVQTLVRWVTGAALQGFTTVILILLVQGTFVLLGLGIIGEYLARIHDEVKGRPRFIVADRTPPAPGDDT